MGSEMIERMARTMAEREGWIWSGPQSQMVDKYGGGQSGHRARDHWRFLAHAALQALMTPTPGMMEAGKEVPCDDEISGGVIYSNATEVSAIWQAMIRSTMEGE